MHSLSEITGKYIGKPFREMPCMHLMYHLYTDLGFDAPDSFGELTLNNYQAQFKKSPKVVQARMLQLIKNLGKPVNVKKIKTYDLIVLMVLHRVIFPAMYVGRGMFMTSTITQGVIIESLNKGVKILLARRLL